MSLLPIVHDLEAKQIFNKIVDLTLTFNPVTLTLEVIEANIDVNPHTNFGTDPSNCIWVIVENVQWWRTKRPSDQATDQLTDQATDRPAYRDAFSFTERI